MAGTQTTAERIETEVLVVGGGMVGMTFACALADVGVAVTVVDRADPASMVDAGFDGRVSAIAYGSRRVIETIGLWPALARQAEPILEIRVSDGDSPLFLHYDHAEIGDQPLGHIVENRHIRRALFDLAARHGRLRLVAPCSVDTVTRGAAGVAARLADGREVRARLVVAADGRGSALRRAAGINVTAWRYPQTGIVCTVAHQRPHRGIAHERFLPAGPFAILPMTGDRSSLVWTERATLAPAMMALDDDAFGTEVARRFGDFLGDLEVVGPRWSYPLSLVHAERYTARRLALIGDAAHAIHPIAGQGLNLGIRDVAVLAEVLVDARRLGLDIGASDDLEHYQRRRRFDSVVLAAATDGLNRLFSTDDPAITLVRGLGLAAVNRAAPLKRLFMRHAMGVVGELPRLARGARL